MGFDLSERVRQNLLFEAHLTKCHFPAVPNQNALHYVCISPSEVSAQQIHECVALLDRGEAVDADAARDELPCAECIALVFDSDSQNIVGVGAIKQRRPRYATRVAERSGYPLDPKTHELGYVAVDESRRRRGISHEITSLLLSKFRERPVFATTSSTGMKRTLSHANFAQQGHEWPGKYGILSLWVKTDA